MKHLLYFTLSVLFLLSSSNAKAHCANPEFTYDSSDGVYIFEGSSDKPVTLWSWTTGDGKSYSSQKFRHQYEKAGKYEVCLKVLTEDNCTGFVCQKIEVSDSHMSDCDLGADFKFDAQRNQLTVAARSNSGQNVRYHWDFGDGQKDKGQEVTHKYSKDGVYNVCLTAVGPVRNSDNTECRQKVCKEIKIGNKNQECDIKADFRIEIKNNMIVVKGRSDAGNSAQYTWFFGDGSRAQGIDARHRYSQRGTYQVCLLVTQRSLTTTSAASICSTRVCKTINIGRPDINAENDCKLKADFEYKNDGNYFGFSARSNDRSAQYFWTISGQNTRFEGQSIELSLERPGNYEVCLTAVTKDGKCKTRICKRVTVGRSVNPYPNPTTDVLHIDQAEGNMQYQILDRAHNVVMKGYSQSIKNTLDVSGLPMGLYTLIITHEEGGIETHQFIKQ